MKLFFKNINLNPECKICVNNTILYKGAVRPMISLDLSESGPYVLRIYFTNKLPTDTQVDEKGNIIADKNFELDKIIIDDYDLEDLKWLSKYIAEDGNIYESCLFFGPKGHFEIVLSDPILPWILEQKHIKNNNDPTWQEDYNYYTEAWKILNQISKK